MKTKEIGIKSKKNLLTSRKVFQLNSGRFLNAALRCIKIWERQYECNILNRPSS